MKKLKAMYALVLSLALMVSSVSTIQVKANPTADQFVNVTVSTTDLISGTVATTATQSAAGHFIEDQDGNYTYYWKFTLDRPGLVTISSVANLFTYNFIGDTTLYMGTDTLCATQISSGFADGSVFVHENAFEAGTYYFKQVISKDGRSASGEDMKMEPYVGMGVTVQYVDRTGGNLGSSKDTAIQLTSGQTAFGLISGQTKEGAIPNNGIGMQYFEVEVTGPTTLNYVASFTRHTDLSHENEKTILVVDEYGLEIDRQEAPYYRSTSSITASVQLPKEGSYYIVVNSARFQKVNMTATWKNPKKEINLKVNKIKKDAKKVSGKAVKGAKITIKVGKKKYTTKAKANGKFSIKVKKIKKGTRVKVTATAAGYKKAKASIKVK